MSKIETFDSRNTNTVCTDASGLVSWQRARTIDNVVNIIADYTAQPYES